MVVSLTSILGGDLISASRSTINSNYDSLNTGKADLTSPSLLGVPNAPTGTYQNSSKQIATNEFVHQAISSVSGGGIITSFIPPTIDPVATAQSMTLNDNTKAHFTKFYMPATMTVNQISVEVATSSTAGDYNLATYSEDGQTRKISVVTPSVSGAGVITTTVPSVLLTPGNYWAVISSNGVANATFRFANLSTTMTLMATSVAGKIDYVGTASVAASQLPTTFTPSDVNGLTDDAQMIFRLDN